MIKCGGVFGRYILKFSILETKKPPKISEAHGNGYGNPYRTTHLMLTTTTNLTDMAFLL